MASQKVGSHKLTGKLKQRVLVIIQIVIEQLIASLAIKDGVCFLESRHCGFLQFYNFIVKLVLASLVTPIDVSI